VRPFICSVELLLCFSRWGKVLCWGGFSGVTVSERVGAEALLWLVGFQQVIKDLVRGYIVFVVQMIIFSEFCVNVIPLYSVDVCPFVVVLQYLHCVLNRAE